MQDVSPARMGAAFVVTAWLLVLGCASNRSTFVYRLPYETGTRVLVWQDHETHDNWLDLAGTDGEAPYQVVAARPGIVRFLEDDNELNCPTGKCENNFVWIQHEPGDEWTMYVHLATGTVTSPPPFGAGLQSGDRVCAGQYLGNEGNVGMADGDNQGRHLHFHVAVPDDPATASPSHFAGDIEATYRIPRLCGVPGGTVVKDRTYTAIPCAGSTCLRSVESPSTEGRCERRPGGEVCVQEVHSGASETIYTRGVDFDATSLRLDVEWCPTADCDPDVDVGRAIRVIVFPDSPDAEPISFVVSCERRRITENVENVRQVVIRPSPELSVENVACDGNEFPAAFARWEICECE